jgi:hypothetical protein
MNYLILIPLSTDDAESAQGCFDDVFQLVKDSSPANYHSLVELGSSQMLQLKDTEVVEVGHWTPFGQFITSHPTPNVRVASEQSDDNQDGEVEPSPSTEHAPEAVLEAVLTSGSSTVES